MPKVTEEQAPECQEHAYPAGVTNVLFRDFPYAGDLPYTWPRRTARLPPAFANTDSGECKPFLAIWRWAGSDRQQRR